MLISFNIYLWPYISAYILYVMFHYISWSILYYFFQPFPIKCCKTHIKVILVNKHKHNLYKSFSYCFYYKRIPILIIDVFVFYYITAIVRGSAIIAAHSNNVRVFASKLLRQKEIVRQQGSREVYTWNVFVLSAYLCL